MAKTRKPATGPCGRVSGASAGAVATASNSGTVSAPRDPTKSETGRATGRGALAGPKRLIGVSVDGRGGSGVARAGARIGLGAGRAGLGCGTMRANAEAGRNKVTGRSACAGLGVLAACRFAMLRPLFKSRPGTRGGMICVISGSDGKVAANREAMLSLAVTASPPPARPKPSALSNCGKPIGAGARSSILGGWGRVGFSASLLANEVELLKTTAVSLDAAFASSARAVSCAGALARGVTTGCAAAIAVCAGMTGGATSRACCPKGKNAAVPSSKATQAAPPIITAGRLRHSGVAGSLAATISVRSSACVAASGMLAGAMGAASTTTSSFCVVSLCAPYKKRGTGAKG